MVYVLFAFRKGSVKIVFRNILTFFCYIVHPLEVVGRSYLLVRTFNYVQTIVLQTDFYY